MKKRETQSAIKEDTKNDSGTAHLQEEESMSVSLGLLG